MIYDMKTVVDGINKLPSTESLEVKLCLLHLLLPFAQGNKEFTEFLTKLRDELLGS